MDWITIIWSASMGACLVLALIHLFAWFHRGMRQVSGLCFPILALGIIALGICELNTMRAESAAAYARVMQHGHLIFACTVAASLWYVHTQFGTGKPWLLGAALMLRAGSVLANYTTGDCLHFLAIEQLATLNFLGEPIRIVDVALPNPWVRIGQLATVVQIAYVTDASLRLWRKGKPGDRRRAFWIGGSSVLLFFVGFAIAGLIAAGQLKAPILVSFPFFGMVLAISYDMGRSLIEGARVAEELEATQRRMALASSAGHLAFWEWDLRQDRIWISEDGWVVFGIEPSAHLDFKTCMQHVHESDRAYLEMLVRESITSSGDFTAEFRVCKPNSEPRWLTTAGHVERSPTGEPTLFRGFSIDITGWKLAEAEAAEQRSQLAHLSRIGTLGELAGALAHELNQPLTAILSNAEVASLGFSQQPPDLRDMDVILGEVVKNAIRAGGIIHSMRAMFARNSSPELKPVDVNVLIASTLALLKGEITRRKARVEVTSAPSLPCVMANFVELQQVLINLVLNALEATKPSPDNTRCGDAPRLHVRTAHKGESILIEVADNGVGIAPEHFARVFTPFFSTKPGGSGLGLGLPISRSIVRRFGGELIALPQSAAEGAVFQIRIPACGKV